MVGTVTAPSVGDPISVGAFGTNGAADLNEYVSPYQAYTPVLGSSGSAPSLGTGSSVSGEYRNLGGRVCDLDITMAWGTSSIVAGTGVYTVTVPVALFGGNPIAAAVLETATLHYRLVCEFLDSTHLWFPIGDGTGNALGPTTPIAPASGNVLKATIRYRTG